MGKRGQSNKSNKKLKAKNLFSIQQSIEKILMKKRGYVFKIPRRQPVILLVSGGLDSAVAIDKVIRQWNVSVYPLFIKRGARAERYEEQAFNFLMKFYKDRFPRQLNQPFKVSAENPPKKFKSYFSKKTLNTIGYPLRDANLQNIGLQYAFALNERYNLNIKTVLIAMTPDETFPHCSILALRAETLLACIDTDDWSWQVSSPFIEPVLGKTVYKKYLIQWAVKYGIPLEKTRSCVSGKRKPDGTCQECKWRLRSFKKVNIEDPLEYESR
jgi:7-cyano-7-deazaguanine synthase in queuosine biosynthesis